MGTNFQLELYTTMHYQSVTPPFFFPFELWSSSNDHPKKGLQQVIEKLAKA
jgi:hypothetical protein